MSENKKISGVIDEEKQQLEDNFGPVLLREKHPVLLAYIAYEIAMKETQKFKYPKLSKNKQIGNFFDKRVDFDVKREFLFDKKIEALKEEYYAHVNQMRIDNAKANSAKNANKAY